MVCEMKLYTGRSRAMCVYQSHTVHRVRFFYLKKVIWRDRKIYWIKYGWAPCLCAYNTICWNVYGKVFPFEQLWKSSEDVQPYRVKHNNGGNTLLTDYDHHYKITYMSYKENVGDRMKMLSASVLYYRASRTSNVTRPCKNDWPEIRPFDFRCKFNQ